MILARSESPASKMLILKRFDEILPVLYKEGLSDFPLTRFWLRTFEALHNTMNKNGGVLSR